MEEVIKTIKGKKIQMSQVFEPTGKVIPVTRVQVASIEDLTDEILNKDVVVIGQSKGKGFTGVMKKWNFAGANTTRGQSDKPRAPGSIGAQTPGRVFKGKKMAGRHGNKRVTIKGLRIVEINRDLRECLLSGPIPGARNSEILIKFI